MRSSRCCSSTDWCSILFIAVHQWATATAIATRSLQKLWQIFDFNLLKELLGQRRRGGGAGEGSKGRAVEEESTNPIQRIFGSITDRDRERESERGTHGNGGRGGGACFTWQASASYAAQTVTTNGVYWFAGKSTKIAEYLQETVKEIWSRGIWQCCLSLGTLTELPLTSIGNCPPAAPSSPLFRASLRLTRQRRMHIKYWAGFGFGLQHQSVGISWTSHEPQLASSLLSPLPLSLFSSSFLCS